MADATPHFHRATGRFLLVGASMVYQNDEFVPDPRPRHTVWSCMNPADGKWSSYRLLEMPSDPEDTFFSAAAGCAQYLELDNGELLIPFYTMSREAARHPWENSFSAAVMRCSFDGRPFVTSNTARCCRTRFRAVSASHRSSDMPDVST